MAQNISCSPWEGTEGPWLCLMTTLSLFGLRRLFSFVSVFLTSLIKLILWLKFVHRQKTGRGHGGQDRKVLLRVTLRSQATHLPPAWIWSTCMAHALPLRSYSDPTSSQPDPDAPASGCFLVIHCSRNSLLMWKKGDVSFPYSFINDHPWWSIG